ncbi:MAG: response regulator transcription factor [Proteobacteria bacterium]|nr:response regulator transcription factor [Pseudomonadota bacterium]
MEPNQERTHKIQILVIDDDKKLCRLIKDYLEPMGYLVKSANDGLEGLKLAQSSEIHVVILDVMMPKMDGFEVLRRLRQKSDVPVLMLTARGDETDRIVGLEMGADDYLPKTFSTRELLARLRAVTRRYQKSDERQKNEPPIIRGELQIHYDSREVRLGRALISLTPIEFDLLFALVKAEGRVLSRDQLLDVAMGRDYDVFDRSIDVHISSLRRKLGDNPKKPLYVKTIRATGYMFVGTG